MKDKRRVYIRVDANEQIALGHLMRTLSIAEAIREAGGDCCFITADSNCEDKFKSYHFESVCLNSEWNDLNKEIDSMVDLIQKMQIECLLVDSYFVTPEYFEEISKWTKVIYIDDLKAFPYKCHGIINYVIGEEGEDYPYFDGNLYTGAQYVPLRKEFQKVSKRSFAKDMKNIMLTTGGADLYHFGVLFVREFLSDERFDHCCITLVVGSKNQDKDYLLDMYGTESRVKIIVDANNMGQLMAESDCIISAGGTTLYEACAAQTPAISYAVADNQLTNVRRFDELGGLYYAGDVRDNMNQVIENILNKLFLMEAVQEREHVANCMKRVVDGKGASRIARILIEAAGACAKKDLEGT